MKLRGLIFDVHELDFGGCSDIDGIAVGGAYGHDVEDGGNLDESFLSSTGDVVARGAIALCGGVVANEGESVQNQPISSL